MIVVVAEVIGAVAGGGSRVDSMPGWCPETRVRVPPAATSLYFLVITEWPITTHMLS